VAIKKEVENEEIYNRLFITSHQNQKNLMKIKTGKDFRRWNIAGNK